MKELFLHNLKAGWLNVLKYKTQNIISVLCLSAGAIFFAVTLYFANMVWEMEIKHYIHNDPVMFNLYMRGETRAQSVISARDVLRQLPSVKSVCYSQETNYSVITNGKWFDMGPQAAYVTPDFFEKNEFRSDVTGKKIGMLKPGTVIATRRWHRVHIGSEPIGRKIRYGKNRVAKISDIVFSTNFFVNLQSVYIVASDPSALISDSTGNDFECNIYSVELNDGYTEKQFKAEFEKEDPSTELNLASEVDWIDVFMFICLILFGATLLITGLSGYLKMQLQLFCLRSREMALRCCNGAKPVQLFMLLCSELFIIFLFVAIVSVVISVGLAGYAMPKIEEFHTMESYAIDLPTMYRTVIEVVVVAFLVAVGTAWFTVRKMLHNPLSTSINSTFSQRTAWNKSMQVTQFVATTILLTVIGFCIYFMCSVANFDGMIKNVSSYKKIGFARNYDQYQSIIKLPSVEKYGWTYQSMKVVSREDSARMGISISEVYRDGDTCQYETVVGNAEAFKLLRIPVESDEVLKDSKIYTPVYVKVSEASSIIKQLGLTYKPSTKTFILPDEKKYIRLGWISREHAIGGHWSNTSFWVLEDKMFEYSKEPNINLLIKPQNDDIDTFLRQSAKYRATTLYDSYWCSEARLFIFWITLLLILAIVSIISIVLTIYSSISLETRGKQKEVAIRKVNGAKTRDIVMLFSRYYIITIGITFGVMAVLAAIVVFAFDKFLKGVAFEDWLYTYLPFVMSLSVIIVVTILTLWQKIYRISHINPANLIKKE